MTLALRSLALALVLLVACGRGGGRNRVTVVLTPDLVSLDHVGAQDTVAASLLDAARQPVSDATVRWRSQDPTVALVSEGVVTAAGDGITRVWAIAGRDSAFAVVAVQSQRAAPANPVTLALSPTTIRFDAAGTTQLLTLTFSSSDTTAVPTCASDKPDVATVDSAYTVTSVANGSTRIRCRLGGAEAGALVEVRQVAVRAAISGRGRSLRLGRDTLQLALARVDRVGSPLPPVTARWRSLDPTIIWLDSLTGTAAGRALGTGRIVGSYGSLTDTTVLRVIDPNPPRLAARSTIVPTSRQTARGGPNATARPGRQAAAAQAVQAQVGVRDIRTTDSIFRAPQVSYSQRSARLTLSLMGEQTERRVDIGLGLGADRTSGVLYGGELKFAPLRWGEVRIRGFAGRLKSRSPGALDATMGDGQVDLGVSPFGWVWLQLGAGVRGYKDQFAVQQWRSLRTGVELRLPIQEGVMQAVLQTTLLPIVRVRSDATSAPLSPNLGLITSGGLEYRAGRFAATALYRLERFDFPDVGGARRREQLSSLRIGLGLATGR